MLKEQDCKPGVEIICINANLKDKKFLDQYSEWVKVGHVYTIRYFKYGNMGTPGIALNEIKGQINAYSGNEFMFGISRFKKLDPKNIQIFYDILSKPIDFKISEDA